MPSGATMQSRCQRVAGYLDMYNNSTNKFWVAIAQFEPWANENVPPVFHATLQTLPQLIGFVYVHDINAVFENADGPIVLPSTAFQNVSDTSVKALAASKAHHVHFEASVERVDLEPLASSYRTIALCTEVEFVDGFNPRLQIGTIVEPSNVRTYFLDWVSTLKAVSVADQDNHTFRIIRTF